MLSSLRCILYSAISSTTSHRALAHRIAGPGAQDPRELNASVHRRHQAFFSLSHLWSALLRQALLLAVRLWPVIPQELLEAIPLLPPLKRPLTLGATGGGVLVTEAYSAAPESAAAAAALFSQAHLQRLLPVLRATTASHPRLHLLWPTLLALLMPGFSPRSVRPHPSHYLPSRVPQALPVKKLLSAVFRLEMRKATCGASLPTLMITPKRYK